MVVQVLLQLLLLHGCCLCLVSIDQYGRSSCSSSLAKRQYEETNQCLYLPFQKASGRELRLDDRAFRMCSFCMEDSVNFKPLKIGLGESKHAERLYQTLSFRSFFDTKPLSLNGSQIRPNCHIDSKT